MFTLDRWQRESDAFLRYIETPSLPEKTYKGLFKGLCLLCTETVKTNPESKRMIEEKFGVCLQGLEKCKGWDWISSQIPDLLLHGVEMPT